MKQIESLIDDIADVLENGTEVPNELAEKYGNLFSNLLKNRLQPREAKDRGTLRMSNIGKPCERQLYYDINNPNDGEQIGASTKLKFLYGDLIELFLLFLAEVSGHTVEGTQDEQEINGVKGHRDAVIDGMVVDIKSASSQSYKKFESGTLSANDPFGYVTQLQSYLQASQKDEKVTDKNRAAFFVADKSLGHFCLDIHQKEDVQFEAVYEKKREMTNQPEPPERGFVSVPAGAGGNEKLSVNCSYCSHKWRCWPELRGFLYSNGPTYLTKVESTPKVAEFNQDGFVE